MSSINRDAFYQWCVDRFGEPNIRIYNSAHGEEICTHSFFVKQKLNEDDFGYHLWMCPSGGKKNLAAGAYRCWKTDARGSLISLVAEYDNIPFEEAEEMICGISSLRALAERLDEFFEVKPEQVIQNVSPIIVPTELPDFSYLIDQMDNRSFWKIKSKRYLEARKIPTDGLYVCTGGDFKDRIVIPYYDQNGKLIFYNARTMNSHPKVLRYMKQKHGDQEKVLFMTSWPKPKSKVYVMEGELDALSLKVAGLVGCACGGKYLSEYQIEMLRNYEPVLAFDADKSGLEALIQVGNALLERGFNKVGYIRPPTIYKDWNNLLQQRNAQTVKGYIERFEKPYIITTEDVLRSNQLG